MDDGSEIVLIDLVTDGQRLMGTDTHLVIHRVATWNSLDHNVNLAIQCL